MARPVLIALLVLAMLAVAASASAWIERLALERHGAALVSTDRATRREAARRLGLEGATEAAVDALLAALERETDPEVRAEIVDALARRRDPRALFALTENVQRLRRGEREARVRALSALEGPIARRALAAALGGEAAELAEARIVELGAPMVEELVPLLDAPATAVRAASALGAIGDPRGVDALIAHLAVEDLAMRAAVLDALGRAGDARAADPVRSSVAHPEAQIAVPALRAIARLGGPDAGELVEAQLAREDEAIAAEALVALAAIDPPRALPRLERALDAEARPALRERAWRAVIDDPDVAFVPLLVREAESDARRGEASDALRRIEAGAGVAALLEVARAHGDVLPTLAIALRAQPEIDDALRDRALALLRSEPSIDRALTMRAVARDDVREPCIARLREADPSARAHAARALMTRGRRDDDVARALVGALASETDELAREAESEALAALGGTIALPTAPLPSELVRAPSLLRAIAIASPSRSPIDARERRRALRGALRAEPARVRVSAVHALVQARDPDASIAIAARLEDAAPEVRRAAAIALAQLGAGADSRIAERLASRLAIEPDPATRRALRDAIAGAPPPTSGESCLHVRLDRPAAIELELVLPDARWIRARTLATGELVRCDLPAADVDVRLAP